ncbi:MAG: RHS repeat-associated core domain-containing protein, partial [Candidatus Thiodiazotropha sp.]
DLHYAYDPTGNITSIRDNAQQTVFFANTQVEPHNDYTYDPLYRLISAAGREHAAHHNQQRDAADTDWLIGVPFSNSPEALQRYVEEYVYDGVGNILSMSHSGGDALRWKRCYQYALDSNRLLATGGANEIDPAAACPTPYVANSTLSQVYAYDVHGNMTHMPHLPLMRWDFQDQLRATSRTVINNGGTPQTTFYVYDASGQRVRKVTERQAGPGQTPTRQHERAYLGGFEIYREYENDGQTRSLERQTLHVMDDQQRVAQVDTRTVGDDGSPQQSRRFQLGNHLGSVSIELDENAELISFEEYHPYGTTALRVVRSASEGSLKRYRYTGKERDEENGLYYHGARYYACWLGRWTAADPIKEEGGINFFSYVEGMPSVLVDPTGTFGAPPVKKKSAEDRNKKKYSSKAKKVFDDEIERNRKQIEKLEKEFWDLMKDANSDDFLDPHFIKQLNDIASRVDKIRQKSAANATIKALDVERNPFYQTREPNTKRKKRDFRCNTYGTDFVSVYSSLLGEDIYFPKYWWSHPSEVSKKESDGTDFADEGIFQQSPSALNRWMHDSKQSEEYGWRKIDAKTENEMVNEAQNLANQGFLVIFTSESHISIVVAETSKVKAGRTKSGKVFQPVVTQAGGVTERGRHVFFFDKEHEGFFVYRKELNERIGDEPVIK